MRVCMLMGSPREGGNTAALAEQFLRQWEQMGGESRLIRLYDRRVKPCLGCMACQECMDGLGCVQEDDFAQIMGEMISSELIVFATPIYAWYCTAPMKALVDRAIYAGNKNYGTKKGPALLAGKCAVTIATCGYPPEKGADVWEEGLKRVCRHSRLHYLGMFCRRDLGRNVPFLDKEKQNGVRDFARMLYRTLEVSHDKRST